MSLLPHPFLMAPIAEITTPALRRAVRSFCKETIIHSEMLSAASALHGGMHNNALLAKYDFDDPFVYQILGTDPVIMGEAAAKLSAQKPLGIDINMGCSAPDILKKGGGSMLLSDIKTSRRIIKNCRKKIDCLLSVKMRSGYRETDEQYLVKFARMLQDEGADYITLHPRHGKMAFKRSADWKLVSLLKDKLRIPVIGNGDIDSAARAMLRLKESGCDGIMFARSAIQEPWIFKSCSDLYQKGKFSYTVDLLQIAGQILDDIEKLLPEKLHKSRGQRFLFYFVKNMTFGHQLFSKIRHVTTIKAMKDFIIQYFERRPFEQIKKLTSQL